jgi:hypothetical protein
MGSEQGLRMAASTAEPPSSLSASDGGGRALELGPRVAARVGAGAVALVLCGALVGVLASHHGRSVVADPPARYGGLPSWLPEATAPVGRTVQASGAHPALAIQGDTVSVDLARGRVLATAVGPSVPEDGRFPVPATSPCTFIVTFASASGVIPLSARAFTFIDEFGHVRHPRVTVMGGGPLPRQVVPGRPMSLKVYDVLPTGDGGLTWAPDGGRPIVSWDFDVEID